MTILKDISDALKDVKNIAKELDITTKNPTSLAKLSAEATLQFPIIVSRGTNVDTAQSIVKALERQYAIFVQIVISMNPYLDLDVDKRGMSDYLRRIHQNNLDIGDFKDLKESAMELYSDIQGNNVFFSLNEGSSPKVLSSNKDQLFCADDYLNKATLNKMYSPSKITLQEALSSMDYFLKKNNIEILTEAKRRKNNNSNLDERKFKFEKEKEGRRFGFEKAKSKQQQQQDEKEFEFRRQQDERDFQYKKQQDDREFEFRKDNEEWKRAQDVIKNQMEKDKFEKEMDKQRSEMRARAGAKLSDNDVKKCNELVPTTLSVVMTEKQGNHFGNTHNFVIGVKGLMHPVNSDEIISNLLSGFKSGNKFFNFLRWTTGEISFVKDLIFNIDGIKEDALRKYKGGSHWWTTLKRRKTVAKLKNIRGKNQLLPNASIVCTMEEISELKETYGLDLMNIKNIKKLMNTYFLLGFVIVDDAQELCYFIFDGESNYQAVSYSGLEKENNSKNDFKEIYKLINSGRL